MSAAELYAFLSDIILQYGDVELRFTNKHTSAPVESAEYDAIRGCLILNGERMKFDPSPVLFAVAFDGIQSGERLS